MCCIIAQVLQLIRCNGAEGRQRSAMNTVIELIHGVVPESVQKLNMAIAKQCKKTLDEMCGIL
jgi:hypothetical protein